MYNGLKIYFTHIFISSIRCKQKTNRPITIEDLRTFVSYVVSQQKVAIVTPVTSAIGAYDLATVLFTIYIGTFHFTHMRAFIYNICDVYYR